MSRNIHTRVFSIWHNSLWKLKESWNSDGQQFHQYQQNKPPFTSNNWPQKDHDIWCWLGTGTKMWQGLIDGIHTEGSHYFQIRRRDQQKGEVNLPQATSSPKLQSSMMPAQPFLSDNWISNMDVRFHSKRQHTITKMNENINMDSTIAGSVSLCITTREVKWLQ